MNRFDSAHIQRVFTDTEASGFHSNHVSTPPNFLDFPRYHLGSTPIISGYKYNEMEAFETLNLTFRCKISYTISYSVLLIYSVENFISFSCLKKWIEATTEPIRWTPTTTLTGRAEVQKSPAAGKVIIFFQLSSSFMLDYLLYFFGELTAKVVQSIFFSTF